MSTVNIPISTQLTTADTNATPSSIALRDSSGGLFGVVVSGSTLQTTGNFQGLVQSKTASFTAGSATHYSCDATSGAITVTLPTASSNSGVVYHFLKSDSSANQITLTGALGTNATTAQYNQLMCWSNGTNWYSVKQS